MLNREWSDRIGGRQIVILFKSGQLIPCPPASVQQMKEKEKRKVCVSTVCVYGCVLVGWLLHQLLRAHN